MKLNVQKIVFQWLKHKENKMTNLKDMNMLPENQWVDVCALMTSRQIQV
jgi:hypothetical protein